MTVLVSDSFNRADSNTTLTTTDSYNGGTAKTWTAVTGTFGISSNQAYMIGTAGDPFAVVDAAQADVKILITLATDPTAAGGIYFRYTNSSNYWRFIKGAGQLYLQKRVSGSNSTPLNPTGLTFADGDVLSVVAQGSSITIYLNGVSKGSVTDTFNQTATSHGIGAQSNNYSSIRFDNFQIEDFSTGGTNASVTVPVATATNSALAPIVTGQASITAVTANVTISGVAPSISAGVNITSIAASATASADAPSVGSATNVTINGNVATVNAQAIAPTVSGQVNISAVTGLSTANANTPLVGSITTINGVVASANVQVVSPSIATQKQVNATSVSASSNVAALAPNVGIVQPDVTISSVVATNTITAITPITRTDCNIITTTSNATINGISPIVALTKSAMIVVNIAETVSNVLAPLVSTIRNVNVVQAIAVAVVTAQNPKVWLNVPEVVSHISLKGLRQLDVSLRGEV